MPKEGDSGIFFISQLVQKAIVIVVMSILEIVLTIAKAVTEISCKGEKVGEYLGLCFHMNNCSALQYI